MPVGKEDALISRTHRKVAVLRHRVTAMVEYKQPVTKNDLQRFMGTVNYYRRLVPGYCIYSAKLSPATKPSAMGGTVYWGDAGGF